MLKVGVLISGRGSNLQALIDAARTPGYPATIACVISNVPDAQGLARAEKTNILTQVIDHRAFKDRQSFEQALDKKLDEYGIELVCMAGFMRLLTPWFVARWRDRLINIHPSLLPAFPGLDTHKKAITAGVTSSGCTVHFVRPEMDHGPIILQAEVPVLIGDNEQALAARVLEAEHRIYPEAVRLIADGLVNIHEEQVFVANVDALAKSKVTQ